MAKKETVSFRFIYEAVKAFVLQNPTVTLTVIVIAIIVIYHATRRVADVVAQKAEFDKGFKERVNPNNDPGSDNCPGGLPADPAAICEDLIKGFSYKKQFSDWDWFTNVGGANVDLVIRTAKKIKKSQLKCFEIYFNQHMVTIYKRSDLTFQGMLYQKGVWGNDGNSDEKRAA